MGAVDDEEPDAGPALLVPLGFAVPEGISSELFRLEPLGLEHNEADLAAWTSSIPHIRATPGFAGHGWPKRPFSAEENAADLARHARDFEGRLGFTYTVLEPATGEVIGCVYLYPPRTADHDVHARSWVRADRAELDGPLASLVRRWLADAWPFDSPDYAAR